MALIRFSDGKNTEVNAATGLKIWKILNGQMEPESDKEARIAEKVNKIYLNWRTAPDDYIKRRFDIIAPMVINSWMVDNTPQHKPTRPQPDDAFNLAFSKKWGLYEYGRPTQLARRYFP